MGYGSFGNLSKVQYEAIGRVACAWSLFHFEMRAAVREVADLDHGTAMKLTADLSSASLFGLLLTLIESPNKLLKPNPPLHDHLLAMKGAVDELRGKRNDYVHMTWLTAKRGFIDGFGDKKKDGKYVTRLPRVPTSDILEVAQRIERLSAKLFEILSDHKESRLRPFISGPIRKRSTLKGPATWAG